MTWALIFWIFGTSAGGPGSAQFETKELCEAAGKSIVDAFGRGKTVQFVCVRAHN